MTVEAPVYVSASQIEWFRGCKRKWWFRHVARVEGAPKHASAVLGAEIQDEQIDPWISGQRNGFDFSRPSGEIAQAVAPLLPQPGTPGLVIRRKFDIPSPGGVWRYRGEFDFWAPDSACVPGLSLILSSHDLAPAPLLGDLKCIGNLDYAKDATALRTDPQCQLYALTTMFEDGCDELDAVWFSTRTRGKAKAVRHHVRLPITHVIGQFEQLEATAGEIVTIRRANVSTADEVPPNPRECDAFGGCPYRHRCNLSPAVQSAAVNQEVVKNMNQASSFLDGLKKRAEGGGASPAVPAPVPAPVAPPAPVVPVPAPVVTLSGVTTFNPSWSGSGRTPDAAVYVPTFTPTVAVVPPPAINPPESALPPAPPVGAAATVAAPTPAPAGDPPKRAPGRPRKETTASASASAPETSVRRDGARIEFVQDLAALMREWKVKRLELDADGYVLAIELPEVRS